MTERLTITRPDDFHVHFRDGAMAAAVVPHTARVFGRAIAMPNLAVPVETAAQAAEYRERLRAARPPGSRFEPLMTCYLTHDTDPDDVERGFRDGLFTALKLYPAHATTNAAHGVTDLRRIDRVLERAEKIGMLFLMHGEEVDPAIDIFDREEAFIDLRLGPLTERFPGLKMVMEHLTTAAAVDFVSAKFPQVAGTITAHHLEVTRTDMLGHGMRPDLYCMPVAKTERDRKALRAAATSGEPCYFLGTDSAPHPLARKAAMPAAAGVFTAPVAIETYASVFDEEGALDKLEGFASLFGARHYGLAPNPDTITLERAGWTVPATIAVDGPDAAIPVYRGGGQVRWRVVE
ncbi:MAG: dihydroorotase [Methylobacteriaceae bacterium]|nr:dihydroorotase [Methylobacteriaceae bacterium]